jgi:acetyltransferase-like isoleucine patch superfamily enzyme
MAVDIFSMVFRGCRKIFFIMTRPILGLRAYLRLLGNGVKFNKTLVCNGLPIVDVHRKSICQIGDFCSINSNIYINPIGRYSPTFIIVRENARLIIGNHTGISSSAIVCHKEIIIGNHVKIGGNVVIYDTDFHSLSKEYRRDSLNDSLEKICKSVVIEDDVFIGAHSIVLKGVTIGKGAIVGAGSTVTRDIPSYEIWAGNPARFIKNIYNVD